jgi:hypothetical protein
MRRRSYFSRILPPPADTAVLRPPRSPLVRPPEAVGPCSPIFVPTLAQPVRMSTERLSAREPVLNRIIDAIPEERQQQAAVKIPSVEPQTAPAGQLPADALSGPFERADTQQQLPETATANQRELRETKSVVQETICAIGVKNSEPLSEPQADTARPESSAILADNRRPSRPKPRISPSPGFRGLQEQCQFPPRPAPVAPVGAQQAHPQCGERIEIGSIEVRLISPPPQSRRTAPPKPSGGITRPYPLAFGLRQI